MAGEFIVLIAQRSRKEVGGVSSLEASHCSADRQAHTQALKLYNKKTLIYTYDMIDGGQGTRPNPSEI
jgi:hypothetical protein